MFTKCLTSSFFYLSIYLFHFYLCINLAIILSFYIYLSIIISIYLSIFSRFEIIEELERKSAFSWGCSVAPVHTTILRQEDYSVPSTSPYSTHIPLSTVLIYLSLQYSYTSQYSTHIPLSTVLIYHSVQYSYTFPYSRLWSPIL